MPAGAARARRRVACPRRKSWRAAWAGRWRGSRRCRGGGAVEASGQVPGLQDVLLLVGRAEGVVRKVRHLVDARRPRPRRVRVGNLVSFASFFHVLAEWATTDSISRNMAVVAVLTASWGLVDSIMETLDERRLQRL